MKLRELRDKYNLTQKELAEKMGIVVVNISRWENYQSVPYKKNIRKLQELFGSDNISHLHFKKI